METVKNVKSDLRIHLRGKYSDDVPCKVGVKPFENGCPSGCSCTHINQFGNSIHGKNR